jgi:hypothetical protein
MKIAILYAGPYRGTPDILHNHIKTFGNNIDMYVSCFEHYLKDWKNSEWPINEYYITPPIDFNETNWSEYRNNEAGQSGFWQYWNLKNVIDNVPKKYDFYIKNRNDLFFETDFHVDFGKIKEKTIYSSSNSFHKVNWNIENWINDEFYIGSEYVMGVIANFVTDYYNTPDRHKLNQWKYGVGSNENSLKNFLTENEIEIDKIYNFKYIKNHYGNGLPTGLTKNFQLEKI